MKIFKQMVCVVLSAMIIVACFSGCSSAKEEKYSDTNLIIGYTENMKPFLEVSEDGKATGFEAELWKKIFPSIKGDLKTYCFEKVDAGYTLEEDGGFFDGAGKEYSAGLMFAFSKDVDNFNEHYSFSEPIITNRVIAVTAKESKIATFNDFEGAVAVTYSDAAEQALEEHTSIAGACKAVMPAKSVDDALMLLDNGSADVLIVDEFSFMPSDKKDSYVVLDNELETIEYVIACAKHSGWKDSINEAIRELKSADYGKGDEFTPLVEKNFGYNASSFNYESDGKK
ncbi:MAG: substrate-binding periplasmic protein [Eubacterium sp.]